MLQLATSNESLFAEGKKVIPGGVNSPIRSWKDLGKDPFIASYGKGDLITDIEGNHYIDYCMSFGALILGHAHPSPVKAAIEAIQKGSTFGVHTPYETALAKLITSSISFCEKVRFVSTGTEAL